MNKSFLNKIRALLLLQKQEILEQIKQEVNIDTDGDEADEIQGNLLIEISNQLTARNSAKLNQIEEAWKRLDDNTYGRCQDCDELIPEKRLLSNPYFQTCVGCAEEREAEEKQRKRL